MHSSIRRVTGLLAGTMCVLLASCGASPGGSSVSPTTVGTPSPSTGGGTSQASPHVAAGTGAPAVPSSGAYLGAWVHPVARGTSGPAFAIEQQNLSPLQSVTGRPLAILHIYSPWKVPAPVADLTAIAANGSMPLLDWGCTVASNVTGGSDDQAIKAYALALKSYGKPVFLRWCWEMNFLKQHQSQFSPAGFVGAWQHIWTVFHDVGATNVSFVWCPGLAGATPAPYFPGDSYVDWIGIDGYDRSGVATFASVFSGFYQTWSGHGRPMMVAETGSMGSNQAAFVASFGTDMPAMPAFKAVVYFDAIGPAGSWVLAGDGLTAFGKVARDPYFNPS